MSTKRDRARPADPFYESHAILLYLAEKTGRLFPSREDREAWWDGMQKLVFGAASIGPMFGQRMHFSYLAPETVSYGIRRYEAEGERLHQVLETMLEGRDYLLGEAYSIVDIAVFGWVMTTFVTGYLPSDDTPRLNAWYERIAAEKDRVSGAEQTALLVRVTATIGNRDALLEQVRAPFDEHARESAFVSGAVYASADEADVVIVHETWNESREAFTRRLKTGKAFRTRNTRAEELVAKRDVTWLETPAVWHSDEIRA